MKRLTKEARLNLAVQAKRSDQKLNYAKLSSIYNVAATTLKARYNGRAAKADTNLKFQKLRPNEEKVIIERIFDQNSRAFPIRRYHVKNMANLLLAERVKERVGTNWTSNFIRRHKKLKTRFNRKIDY